MTRNKVTIIPNATAAFLRGRREGLGITREDIAATIGRSVSTIRRWESIGIPGGISANTIRSVAVAYGVSADDICDRLQLAQ